MYAEVVLTTTSARFHHIMTDSVEIPTKFPGFRQRRARKKSHKMIANDYKVYRCPSVRYSFRDTSFDLAVIENFPCTGTARSTIMWALAH